MPFQLIAQFVFAFRIVVFGALIRWGIVARVVLLPMIALPHLSHSCYAATDLRLLLMVLLLLVVELLWLWASRIWRRQSTTLDMGVISCIATTRSKGVWSLYTIVRSCSRTQEMLRILSWTALIKWRLWQWRRALMVGSQGQGWRR